MKLAALTILAASLAVAGCVGAPAEVDAASATDTPAEATLVQTPFNAEGSTFHGAAVCAPPAGCVGQSLPGAQGESVSWFEADLEGVLQEAELTLTWSAATTATEELLLGIAYETEDGATDWITARGPSPLTLSEKGIGLDGGAVQAIYVNAFRCTGAAPAYGCTSVEQPFAIEGTLTTTSS